MFPKSLIPFVVVSIGCLFNPRTAPAASSDSFGWPPITQTTKPWAYWWWMASAVDTNNLTKELNRYRDAGMGGVHIIPIYGAKGWESNYISYLSPKWMAMLSYTVTEARRLGLGVDMTTGSGWCFGGPKVTDDEANASVVWQTHVVAPGTNLVFKLDAETTQAIVAFTEGQPARNLTPKLARSGLFAFTNGSVRSVLYVVSQKPSGQKVKRASPGGEGWMLNLASPKAMTDYLRWMDEAFAGYKGAKPRSQYHDSYEYRTDWSPEFFAEFQKRRGYRLQDELPALFANAQPPRARGERDTPTPAGPPVDADRISRVKCDYRETISDIMAEETLPMWADWSKRRGFLTRNEAHGSPGNWLDLYAAADIPETEMFYKDRNKLISKFASSAGHVAGKNLVSSETGTWLNEHFTETLADMKYLLDDLFLSGINHIFYHGCCYSPDEAGWPGWLFYASYEMNPRNPVWRDVPTLNAYAARCQSILQAGKPDNDILLYWPLHDFWRDSSGLARNMTVHARDWFEDQPIGRAASELWKNGYAFDYISDRQLVQAKSAHGDVKVPGGEYRVVVVPECDRMPLASLRRLLALAKSGSTVIFETKLPSDVPGLTDLEKQRAEFQKLISSLGQFEMTGIGVKLARLGSGRVVVGPVEPALIFAKVRREPMFSRSSLMCLRRSLDGGAVYFIANRSESDTVSDWIPLARKMERVLICDPMTSSTKLAASRPAAGETTEVFLQLQPGESVILRSVKDVPGFVPAWTSWQPAGAAVPITNQWRCTFIAGGPEIPAQFTAAEPASWSKLDDTNAQRFAGTALYSVRFDKPSGEASAWQLDLGKVCQSARVRLNGGDLGTLITPPFQAVFNNLKPTGNLLEVEVTSTSANRIRDLDRRGVQWKNFHDINIVNLGYKPFDASDWPLADVGLLGPVTLTPMAAAKVGE